MSGKKARGKRKKTRYLYTKSTPKVSVNDLLKDFDIGATVQVNIESSIHGGLPHYYYQGKTGKVIGKRGRSFEVLLKNGNQDAMLVVSSAHLAELQSQSSKPSEAVVKEVKK